LRSKKLTEGWSAARLCLFGMKIPKKYALDGADRSRQGAPADFKDARENDDGACDQ
jgi:hypothetical protein